MSMIKKVLMLKNEILEKNDCFYHDGSPSEDTEHKWTDCKYVYATYSEITDRFSTAYKPLDIEEKILWEIDDSGCKAKALPEISEIVSHLVFLGVLTGLTQD